MGSPFDFNRTARIHAVTTLRGSAMILHKILRSACIDVMSTEEERLSLLTEALSNTTSSVVAPIWSGGDVYTWAGCVFSARRYECTILTEYLQAVVESKAMRRSVALCLTARYDWQGSDDYECVVFFNFNNRGK